MTDEDKKVLADYLNYIKVGLEGLWHWLEEQEGEKDE